MSTPSALVALAQAILKDASTLDEHFRTQNLPQPAFDVHAPPRIVFNQPDLIKAHESLLANTKELHHLALGPVDSLRQIASIYGIGALAVVHRLKIAHHVPLDGQISFEDLAAFLAIPVLDVKCVVRLAMTDWIFCEPTPGMVAHTAASRLLMENPLVQAITDMGTEELFPAAAKVSDALIRYPGSQEPTQSGWGVENNAQAPLFEELVARHPRRAANFASAMAFYGAMIPPESPVQAFDWASLGKATVVDVGGAKGPASIALARAFPDLTLIVQDLEGTVKDGRNLLPEDVQGRVSFDTHDFFTPQPIKDADVYFFRAIFHDYSDKYAVQILQNLVPALKKGARVIIQDPHLPVKGTVSPWREREAMQGDFRMMAFLNAHNRLASDYEPLVKQVDPRFGVNSTKVVTAGRDLVVAEVLWDS